MNWDPFKDPVSHLCVDGAGVAFWCCTVEAADSNPFNGNQFNSMKTFLWEYSIRYKKHGTWPDLFVSTE